MSFNVRWVHDIMLVSIYVGIGVNWFPHKPSNKTESSSPTSLAFFIYKNQKVGGDMPRKRSPNRDKAYELWIKSDRKRELKDIAKELGVSDSLVRNWKNQDAWDNKNKVTSLNIKNDVTKQKPKKSRKGIGNPSPVKKFTERNSAARKHGLNSKYFTDTQREIIKDFEEYTIADQLWIQIELKFSAIVQLQKVMWVEAADKHLSESTGYSNGDNGNSESFKVAFAYEQYESYINAQSRAMAEYRNLIKHFLNLAHEDDVRRLKIQTMKLDIEKKQAEIETIKGPKEGQGIKDWKQAVIDAANKRKEKEHE